jgi:hypothetical protein
VVGMILQRDRGGAAELFESVACVQCLWYLLARRVCFR